MPSIQRSRSWLSREQCAGTPKSPRASVRTGSLDNDVAFDEALSPKLNDLPIKGSTSGIRVSFSLFVENGASAPATLPNEVVAPKIQDIKNFGLHQTCSVSLTLVLILDRRNCSTAQGMPTHRVVQVNRTIFYTGIVSILQLHTRHRRKPQLFASLNLKNHHPPLDNHVPNAQSHCT